MKRIFQLLAFAYLITGCNKEDISIPVPVTHKPVRVSDREIKFSMSIEKNANKGLKTGFVISLYGISLGSSLDTPIIYPDSESGGVFSVTLHEERLFSGVEYAVRSCIESDGKRIYGNQMFFETTPGFGQSISSLVPNHGQVNDTFEIIGENFIPGFTEVWFSDEFLSRSFQVELLSVTENKIVAKVPDTGGLDGSMRVDLYVYHYDFFQFVLAGPSFIVD